MDQLKVILKQVQKYHFWVLCVVAMIAALLGWFMAKGSLSTEYTKNKGTIEGKFSALQGILSAPDHPNSTWTEAINKLTSQQRETVRKAWETVYNEQRKGLEWPPEMGKDFLDFINNNPPTATIHPDYCRRYQDRIIKSEFPRLLAIVDATSVDSQRQNSDAVTQGANRGKGAAPPPEQQHEYKVVWVSGNQEDVRKSLNFDTTPSSAEVRQAQEDIWVYKALLKIIRAMNTDQRVNVKKITEISIGQAAAKTFLEGKAPGKIIELKSTTAAAAGGGSPVLPVLPTEGGEAAAKPIDEGRYVEADGKALAAGTAASQQFKRMPVIMRLSIDQREVNRLLVECANSQLPVEVRQLRIGTPKKGSSGPAAPGGAPAAMSESEVFEVPIELAGIIYIYNPPDMTKLGAPETVGSSVGGQ